MNTAESKTNKQFALISRSLRWLRKPGREQRTLLRKHILNYSALPFYFGKAYVSKVFVAYQPDSQSSFNAHPEFDGLYEKFIKHNKRNNSGDVARLWSLMLNIKQIMADDIEGDFAELGVWRGNTAAVLAHYAARSNRRVFLFDTFAGFDEKDLDGIDADKRMAFEDTSIELVKDVIGQNVNVCELVKGHFPESIVPDHRSKRYAVVSLDCDLYEPMKAGLEFFYPLLSKGGILFLHDYSSMWWDGSKKAVDDFFKERDEYVVLLPDKSGSAFVRKANGDRCG